MRKCGGLGQRTKDILSKIGLVVEKLFKLTCNRFLGTKCAPNGLPKGKIQKIDQVSQVKLNIP